MAGRLILGIFNPALDDNGVVDDGTVITYYENETTTYQAIYDGPDLETELPNPLGAPDYPDAGGRFPQVWGPNGAVYSVKIELTGAAPITYDNIALTADPAPSTIYYDMYRFIPVTPDVGATVILANIPRPLVLAQDLNDGVYPSIFTIGTNPTATMAFALYKNAVSIGTVSFSTSGVPTVTFPDEISFEATDQFIVVAPTPVDATGALIAMTFVFRAA